MTFSQTLDFVRQGRRLAIPSDLHPTLQRFGLPILPGCVSSDCASPCRLLSSAWAAIPGQRPTCADVWATLTKLSTLCASGAEPAGQLLTLNASIDPEEDSTYL